MCKIITDDDNFSNINEAVIEDEENLTEDAGVYDLAEITESSRNHTTVSLLEDVANKTTHWLTWACLWRTVPIHQPATFIVSPSAVHYFLVCINC